MKKAIIIVKDKFHLKKELTYEIKSNGKNCDLNHLDVSNIIDMSQLFYDSEFNGDISQWKTSNVISMEWMFCGSKFNGDISNWNITNTIDIHGIFYNSKFNGNISKWNISNINNMSLIFYESKFNQDISHWNIENVDNMRRMFEKCTAPQPWWYIEDNELRKNAIEKFNLNNQLQEKLRTNEVPPKKLKI